MKKTKCDPATAGRKAKIGTVWVYAIAFAFFAFRFSRFVFSALWRWVREVSGDDAYERYVASRGETEPRLSPGEFYRVRLERKYSRPCRCC